jgi:hypothetical protein
MNTRSGHGHLNRLEEVVILPAAWGLITDGYARFMASQPRDGHSILCQGIRELEARGLLFTISWAYALLAEVTLILNDVKSGLKLSAASKDSVRDGDRIAEPMTYRALGIGVHFMSLPNGPMYFHISKMRLLSRSMQEGCLKPRSPISATPSACTRKAMCPPRWSNSAKPRNCSPKWK